MEHLHSIHIAGKGLVVGCYQCMQDVTSFPHQCIKVKDKSTSDPYVYLALESENVIYNGSLAELQLLRKSEY